MNAYLQCAKRKSLENEPTGNETYRYHYPDNEVLAYYQN